MAARRFYSEVSVSSGHGILLDGKPVLTPAKSRLLLPTPAAAEAVAVEWRAQGAKIDPHSMPLTKLANTAIDRIAAARETAECEIAGYAGSDLVCYRTGAPESLRTLQDAAWDPVLAFARSHLGHDFRAVTGIRHVPQSADGLAALARHLRRLDDFTLAAIFTLTALTGSALLALMLAARATAPEDAWRAAHVDEDWQIRHWGEDAEAAAKRRTARAGFDAACRFLMLVDAPCA